ncbi:MAG: HAD-IIIA family hydrolase [Owenweeksia sp.]|nr:HAD-IIIA family hydrolase [Owenweeksia sp.]
MKAVILAGGKGTRLGALTQDIPKPMVALAGKPILQYQVELCARYGLAEIILIVNHLGHAIEQHFGDGKDFGIPIRYFHESEPLGTVGGIKELEAELRQDFLVLYGDVMMEMNLQRLMEFHQQKASEATLVVHPNDHPHDSDLVEMDETQRIIKVLPKPHAAGSVYHNMVNAAVYLFSPVIFRHLKKGEKADFGKDIFPQVYRDLRMYGYNTPEYLKDMGTPERKTQVEADIHSGKVARRSMENRQRAIFLDRDGVINEDVNLIHRPEDLHLYPFAGEAIRSINQSDYLAILATNRSVVARNLTDIAGLGEIHKKMETQLGKARAKLDDIRFCPHHPDGGYPEENKTYKIDCHCRKPKPGMLLDAATDFNIDLKESWMIGDSERDTLAGRAAGCTTIGVMTGSGHRNATVLPDYFFGNLLEAVTFIIREPYRTPAQKLLQIADNCRQKPLVINIGGNSRSGKSSFATYLSQQLHKAGKKVLIVKLDDWILPKAERRNKEEVWHNFSGRCAGR